MIPQDQKVYNLHYNDVRGGFFHYDDVRGGFFHYDDVRGGLLRPPHGTSPSAVKTV